MKLGIVINTSDPETAWNAVRLGSTAIDGGHKVSVFLLGSGVEIEKIRDEEFNVNEALGNFVRNKGNLLACGTCLKIRQQQAGACPVSTMPQLVQMIADSDKVVTFG
jgi:sulfur relay (sulfurtransferase) complex TusBCD TusD component (DsrE family)